VQKPAFSPADRRLKYLPMAPDISARGIVAQPFLAHERAELFRIGRGDRAQIAAFPKKLHEPGSFLRPVIQHRAEEGGRF
jgi:hypothetical protein